MHAQRRRKKKVPQGTKTVEVIKGHNGFGFTIYGQQPCILSSIVPNSPADLAGLKIGNILISINGINVVKYPHDTVVQLIGNSPGAIQMTVADHYYTDSSDEESIVKPRGPVSSRTRSKYGHTRKAKVKHRMACNNNRDLYKYHSHQGLKLHDRRYKDALDLSNIRVMECDLRETEDEVVPSCSHSGLGNNEYPPIASSSSNHKNIESLLAKKITHHNILGKESLIECKVIVGYLGTIEMPKQIDSSSKLITVKSCIRKLRQEKRSPTTVLMTVLPSSLTLKTNNRNIIAEYPARRINYVSCSSENDYRYFGLVTSATHINSNDDIDNTETESESLTVEISNSCHVFSIDPKLIDHSKHVTKAEEFQIKCQLDPVTNNCLEFPNSSEYIVNIIKMMYNIKTLNGCGQSLEDISKLALKGNSPNCVNLARNVNRPLFRGVRQGRRAERHDGNNFVANSPQPSNHSEITTTSSNSDSGIGFHNDCQNIADRILVVDFPNNFNNQLLQVEVNVRDVSVMKHRPIVDGLYDMDNNFLSNTLPVVDDFKGQGRPLNHADDVFLDIHHNSFNEECLPCHSRDNFNCSLQCHFNNSNIPDIEITSPLTPHYDAVYTEAEENHYEMIKQEKDESNYSQISEEPNIIYAELNEIIPKSCVHHRNISTDDSVSIYSSHSNDYTLKQTPKGIQSSVDNILILGTKKADDHLFLHPSNIKTRLRNGFSKTKQILNGRKVKSRDKLNEYKLSPKVFDVSRPCVSVDNLCVDFDSVSEGGREWKRKVGLIEGATSEPDLRVNVVDQQSEHKSEQNSPFRRWAGGGGNTLNHTRSYRRPSSLVTTAESEHDMTSKDYVKLKEGGVAKWSLGLEHLLRDPYGTAAFAAFLSNEYAAENIKFWWACEKYRANSSPALAKEIWDNHLGEKASDPVNVDSSARNSVQARLEEAPDDLFSQAQQQIFNLLKFDSYPRFLRSSQHAECARAELCGTEMPYQPPNSGVTKLKKSASNADERRRNSLFPWPKRSVSKERCSVVPEKEDKSTNVNTQSVAASQLDNLHLLCRLKLPDGVSTVVSVNSKQTIRQFVDKLLNRHGIVCSDYDVLFQGFKEPLKQMESCSILAGHEANVDRRVRFRIENCGRSYEIRCRPSKCLNTVLTQLLPGNMYVLNDGKPLPDGALAQDVEGVKLQVALRPDHSDSGDKQLTALDEITNRVFDEVLQGKVEFHLPASECSVRSEICESECSTSKRRPSDTTSIQSNRLGSSGCVSVSASYPSKGTVVAKLRAGVNVQSTANLISNEISESHRVQCRLQDPNPNSCGLPNSTPNKEKQNSPPVPASRNISKPLPAVRTSLKKSSVANDIDNCKIEPVNPPPLPPKPKKPPHWSNQLGSIDKDIIEKEKLKSRLHYLDRAASSLV